MSKGKGNDLDSPVTKFCLTLEGHRRTPEGRTRTSKEFLAHYFSCDDRSTTDRIFRLLPAEVRGPILTSWGIRGEKMALRDSDEKVQSVVHDALVAGDLDDGLFEELLIPGVVIRWVDLADWWEFWRRGSQSKHSIRTALAAASELGLFDAAWFLETLGSSGSNLRGTDVLCEGLSKAELAEWVRGIHASGNGTPKGLVAALGWEKIVAKTADGALLSVLDALASKNGLSQKVAAAAKPLPNADYDMMEDSDDDTSLFSRTDLGQLEKASQSSAVKPAKPLEPDGVQESKRGQATRDAKESPR